MASCAGRGIGLMESIPIRLVTQDDLRAGAKRILDRRRRALVALWGGFLAAVPATFVVPTLHVTLLRRSLRAGQCLQCGFDLRHPEEQGPGPTTIERRLR
jgi:hypothetical protein